MWCYVESKNEEQYLEEYPNLKQYWEKLVLMRIKDAAFLPRLFIYNYPSKLLVEYLGKSKAEFESVNFEFKGKLRPEQKKAIDSIMPIFQKQGYLNGIIKLPPGTGKTVLTICLASMIGLKTCIVVNKESIFSQWVKEIIKFTGCSVDDVGIIKQQLFVTENKLFTVAMSGTLVSKIKRDINKGFKQINDAKFGLTVYDEVHATSASEIFSKVSLLFRTRNVIGLSATPFHYAVAQILMENTIGVNIYESNEYNLIPRYNIIHYDSGLKKYSFVMNKMNDYIKQKGFYNKVIIKSETYLKIIKELTKKLHDEGRKVIIICMSINQVKLISEHLNIMGINHRRYYGKEKEIDKENDRVVVATYSFSGAGFDMKSLDSLILATSLSGRKSLIQVVGRILRQDKDKKQPIVYDLADVAFPMLTTPELNRKKKIIKNEFPNCIIQESTYNPQK